MIATAGGFARIAAGGFGDPLNAYAHVMHWHDGDLYVGTTRANLHLRHAHDPPALSPWPVRCPEDIYDLDLRAHVWRYRVQDDRWDRVLVAPWLSGPDGPIPRDIGYRGLASFKGPGDRAPALYVSTWSPRKGDGALVLRGDGDGFTPVSAPGLGLSVTRSLRALVAFRDRLYTSPMGVPGGRANVADLPVVLESEDPASGRWQPVSDPGFGDPDNLGIIEMVPFAGRLYAGTVNPRTGFQLWRTDADGARPYRWRKVLGAGAYRGPANEAALSLAAFGDALYVGTGIQGGGFDRAYGVGPAAAELVRVFPDDSWELVVGTRRPTPAGMAVPASGLGPGFGNFFAGYLWRLCEHDSVLYASTWDWSVFLPYLPLGRLPRWFTRVVRRAGLETVVRREGGADLWRSRDGTAWEAVTRTGFGNEFNAGIRTLASTPYGLFAGTANPFAPEVATRNGSGWDYTPNPRGGLEIWHARTRTSGDDGLQRASRLDRRPAVPLRIAGERDAPLPWPAGYWTPRTPDAATAARDLAARLARLAGERPGRLLDAACSDATTPRLAPLAPPAAFTGIATSRAVVDACRALVPGARFEVAAPTSLPFADAAFDTIVCVEPAARFDTRADMLAEAWRVLAPGGRLVLADVICSPEGAFVTGTRANHVRTLDEYRDTFLRRGFTTIATVDVTRECWYGHLRHRAREIAYRADRGEISPIDAIGEQRRLDRAARLVIRCVLVAAEREQR
jgi:SAM-dependent methyltransferase